jgi:hypothetical protein
LNGTGITFNDETVQVTAGLPLTGGTLADGANVELYKTVTTENPFTSSVLTVKSEGNPDGNYRNYFDWYMLNHFQKLSGTDNSINISKIKRESKEIWQKQFFTFIDYEYETNNKTNNLENYLNEYFNFIDKFENYKFNNCLERFIFYFDVACRSTYTNNVFSFGKKIGDLFGFKFDGNFIENKGKYNEGHITNGFIGQQVRYLSLRQTNYNYKGKEIKRPIHLIWRDAHTNCLGENDSQLIKSFYEASKNSEKKEFYLLASNNYYVKNWHDYSKCGPSSNYNLRSAIAGVVQMTNFNNTNLWLNDLIYYQTIGMTFMIDTNGNIPIEYNRPYQERGTDHEGKPMIVTKYEYGIDEYINTSFFNIDHIRQRSIYYKDKFIVDIFPHNYWEGSFIGWNNEIKQDVNFHDSILSVLPIKVSIILLYYLKNKNIWKDDKIFNIFDFIYEIEKLRNNKIENKDEEKMMRLLLSIYPTKYLIQLCIFTQGENLTAKYQRWQFKHFLELFEKSKYYNEAYTNLSFANLEKIGINCNSTAINSAIEWCINPYIESGDKNVKCPPANFYSGFYYENPPSLDIGILRQPSDFKYVIKSVENNKLRIPLNKSDYKLKVEKNNVLVNDIITNIDDGNNHIKPALQNIILHFGKLTDIGITEAEIIAQKSINIKNETLKDSTSKTHSDIWVPLIWKALNYAGYDIPPKWFKIDLNDDKSLQFNSLVKKLASISGWADYAINVLINDNDTYKEDDNTFESEKVKQKSKQYNDSYKSKDFKKYKMATYIKYLKYKNKYLKLKSKVN